MPLTNEKLRNVYPVTPGPWVAREGLVIAPEFGWKGEIVAKPMAQALDNLDHSTWRAEGNARLIAAAPDMLAALESIAARLDHIGIAADTRPAYDMALHAIAKAKGGAA